MPSGLKILVVDDAMFMRKILKDTLTDLGHKVIGEAENGADALKQYEKLKPDLVFLDVVMPDVSGMEALKNILNKNPKAKIIMVSALDQKQEVEKAKKMGAADFIIKPFDPTQIAKAIDKISPDLFTPLANKRSGAK